MEDVKFLQGTYGIAALIKDLLAGVQSGCIFNYYYYFFKSWKKTKTSEIKQLLCRIQFSSGSSLFRHILPRPKSPNSLTIGLWLILVQFTFIYLGLLKKKNQ